jgi:hypothetical protein
VLKVLPKHTAQHVLGADLRAYAYLPLLLDEQLTMSRNDAQGSDSAIEVGIHYLSNAGIGTTFRRS